MQGKKKKTTLIPAWFYLQLWLLKPLSWSSTLTPPLLVPWFSRCQHLQADRDPDQSPSGPEFPMDSASPRCSDHPRLGLYQRHKLISLHFLRAHRVGILGKLSSLVNVDRWLAGWDRNLCFWSHPYVKVAPNEVKWGRRKERKDGAI